MTKRHLVVTSLQPVWQVYQQQQPVEHTQLLLQLANLRKSESTLEISYRCYILQFQAFLSGGYIHPIN